jgi:hypothetical protein
MCGLAVLREKTFLTTRPASFFSATAIAASTSSRDVAKGEEDTVLEVDAVVEGAVEDGGSTAFVGLGG